MFAEDTGLDPYDPMSNLGTAAHCNRLVVYHFEAK